MVHITRVALRQSAPKLSFGRRAGAAVGQQMMRGLGWLVLLASCALAAAFLTYHPADYSLNSQPFETDHIKNIMGPVGAVVADVLVQAFGWGAYLLLLVLPTWGWRLKSAAALDHFAGRLLMLLAALVSASVMFEMVFPLPQPRLSTSFGGAAGQLVAQMVLPAQPLPWMVLLAAATCVVVAAFATYMSCALSLAEWRGLVHAGHECARSLMRAAAALGRHAIRVLRQAKEQDVIATEHEEIDPPQDTPPDAETKQKVRVAPVRKAAASARQGRLALDRDHESSLPPLELLSPPDPTKSGFQQSDMVLEQQAKALETVLDDFGVQGNITKVSPGPVVTLYELEPAPGIRASRVIALADDIARNMSAASVRVAVVPGRNVMGIELPNRQRETVYMRELLLTPEYQDNRSNLPLILGKDISGAPIIADLARMPHLLVAGTTGSGKSVSINTMILSLVYRLLPSQCRFIMIDPKMLELSVYDGIPHLLAPVVTEPKKAITALKWTVREMEERYRAMSKLGVRNIEGYNVRLKQAQDQGETLTRQVQTGFDQETGRPIYEEQPLDLTPLPFIVVIVDEMADLMLVAGKEIEIAVQRLAQMARAAGIHMIMATQRPSVDVITGTIKANFPTRISFQVTSKIDSRTILGEQGAEQLLGQGDMLYMAGGGRVTRVHGPFVRDSEVESVVKFLKSQGEPDYLDDVTADDEADFSGDSGGFGGGDGGGDSLYDKAVDIVQREGKASTSFLQRHLQIGYNKAATLIERMEKEGVVSPANHVGKREVFGGR